MIQNCQLKCWLIILESIDEIAYEDLYENANAIAIYTEATARAEIVIKGTV